MLSTCQQVAATSGSSGRWSTTTFVWGSRPACLLPIAACPSWRFLNFWNVSLMGTGGIFSPSNTFLNCHLQTWLPSLSLPFQYVALAGSNILLHGPQLLAVTSHSADQKDLDPSSQLRIHLLGNALRRSSKSGSAACTIFLQLGPPNLLQYHAGHFVLFLAGLHTFPFCSCCFGCLFLQDLLGQLKIL